MTADEVGPLLQRSRRFTIDRFTKLFVTIKYLLLRNRQKVQYNRPQKGAPYEKKSTLFNLNKCGYRLLQSKFCARNTCANHSFCFLIKMTKKQATKRKVKESKPTNEKDLVFEQSDHEVDDVSI